MRTAPTAIPAMSTLSASWRTMGSRPCPTCGQPLPDKARRDPPLAPLEQPNVVTIHDLPEGERERAKVEITVHTTASGWKSPLYRLRTARQRDGDGR